MGYTHGDTTEEERLLRDSKQEEQPIKRLLSQSAHGYTGRAAYLTVIVCLMASNLALVFLRKWQPCLNAHSNTVQDYAAYGRSQFAGLSYNTPVIFTHHSDYLSDNNTAATHFWDSINTDPVIVALSDEYAAANGIERSQFRFVWDESKGIYFIKLFHNLHCLKAMRRILTEVQRGVAKDSALWHFHHCLDNLRQDLLCQADDTPMPMVQLPDGIGYGQTRICRNYDDLVAWTQDIERNACYHRFTDYEAVKHKIEMYAFCPEDSPYYEVSSAYFQKWGHLDPFDDGKIHNV